MLNYLEDLMSRLKERSLQKPPKDVIALDELKALIDLAWLRNAKIKEAGAPASEILTRLAEIKFRPPRPPRGYKPLLALNDNDVDEMLRRVGHSNVPAALNRTALDREISAAWDFCNGYKREAAKRARTIRREYAREIASVTSELSRLLEDGRSDAEWVRNSMSRNRVNLAGFKDQLHNLSAAAAVIENVCTGQASMRDVLGVTPKDWFLGHDLAGIFERHFPPLKAKRDRTVEGDVGGVFIQFATAVACLLGDERCSAETVSSAMSSVERRRLFDGDPIAVTIRDLAIGGGSKCWTGTKAELLDVLKSASKSHVLPETIQDLDIYIDRIEPTLSCNGIVVERRRHHVRITSLVQKMR